MNSFSFWREINSVCYDYETDDLPVRTRGKRSIITNHQSKVSFFSSRHEWRPNFSKATHRLCNARTNNKYDFFAADSTDSHFLLSLVSYFAWRQIHRFPKIGLEFDLDRREFRQVALRDTIIDLFNTRVLFNHGF